MPREILRAFPLSYGQRALWYMQRLFPESPLYNLQSCWRILSDLDVRALRRTFQWLVDRHESLRTTFHLEGREPIQVVHPGQTAFFQVIDASDWSEKEFGKQVDREVHRPFDLERGPLFRVLVFLREPGSHLLVTSFHHITADLWSMTLIYQEMQRLYPAAREGALPPPSPAPPYADYVRWQQDMLSGPDGKRLRAYWRGRFEGEVKELRLPFDFPRGPSPDCAGAALPFKLDETLTGRLRELAVACRTTLHTVLLAAFETLLHLVSGNDLFLIRTLAVGRSRAEWEQIIGFFANPVVMRVDFRDRPSFLEAVSRTRTRVSEAVDKQDYPFELLMEGVRFGRGLRFNPMSEVMFVLQAPQRFLSERRGQKCALENGMFAPGPTGVRVDFGGLLGEKYNPGTETTLNDLDLQTVEIGGELSGVFGYRTDLFRQATIAGLAADLRLLLDRAVKRPEEPVDSWKEAIGASPLIKDRSDSRRTDEDGGGPRSARARDIGREIKSGDIENGDSPRVAEIVGEILGIAPPAPGESFFELGGNSLQALRLTLALREAFQIEVPLGRLFENPTIAGLAALVRRTPKIADSAPILPAAGHGGSPLSFAQERLWFIDRLMGGSFYNIPVAVRLKGPLDLGALEASLNRIVERHEALRTTFAEREGRPVQIVHEAMPVAVEAAAAEGPTEAERLEAARRLAETLAARPFDLERGPLLRLGVFELGRDDHLALLVIHHIAADAWSFGVLLRELAAFYGASVLGGAPAVPELGIQYADFAAWQRRLVDRESAGHLDYWRRVLAGAAAAEFPTDAPRPAVQTFRGGACRVDLRAPLVASLKKFCAGEGVTPFMGLLAAFFVLFERWSGSDDLVVGTPTAGRRRPEVENLIGCFINPLPIRVGLGGDPTFGEVVAQVKERVLAAFEHQDIPFEKIVEEAGPARDLGREPIFQTMFVLQNAPLPQLRLPGGPDLIPFEIARSSTRYDLTLFLTESAADWTGWLEFNSGLFRPETAARLARHFVNILEAALASPGRRLSAIPMMSGDEVESAMSLSQAAPPRGAAPAESLHGLFAARAAAAPDLPAVVCGDKTISYRELGSRTRRIAGVLASRGAGPEMIVGVCVGRTPDLPAALLGVLRAGAAYLPIDPAWPGERVAGLLADSGAVAVLADAGQIGRLSGLPIPVLGLDDIDRFSEMDNPAAAPPGAADDPDRLACVIYTSGSTGKPKGVMVTHGALSNYISWCTGAYELTEGNGALVHTSAAYDFSVTTLLAPLTVGQKIIMVPDSPGGIAPDLLPPAGGLTAVKLTPSHARALGCLLSSETLRRLTRTLVLGGEALDGDHLTGWLDAGSGLRIFNEYGPTEATVGCCVHRVLPADAGGGAGPVPIGRPVAGAGIYVLDGRLQQVPAGVPGEIFIGGPGLARGYLGAPGLTAERFVPDPAGAPGSRIYRTGDLGRRRADGVIEFLGRLDDQIKVRGYRVEPGEIEGAILGCAGAVEAAVVAFGDTRGGIGLAAFVAPDRGATIAPQELRENLRSRLPEYMVPAEIRMLERLPRLASGKVDKRELERLAGGLSSARRPSRPPETAAEIEVARAFEKVLGIEGVGAEDDFFELGGHSLAALELLAEVRRFSASGPGLLEFFKDPRVAAVALAIGQPALAAERPAEKRPPAASLVILKPGGGGPPLFLAHPSGGQAHAYRPLAAALDVQGPVFGIAARGASDPAAEHASIEAMAEEYAGLVLRARPAGPFRLAGWSMGAAVALAVAAELEKRGREVEFVGLLDPTISIGILENEPPAGLAEMATGLASQLTLGQETAGQVPPGLAERLAGLYSSLSTLTPEERAARLAGAAAGFGPLAAAVPRQSIADGVRLLEKHGRLLDSFRPPRIHARTVVWEAAERGPRRNDPSVFDRLTSGPLERHAAAGNHWSMLSAPHVAGLAADLARVLGAPAAIPDEKAECLKVVVNAEGQYSIWPGGLVAPGGWTETGAAGTRAECLETIGKLWTDLRPLGLRRRSSPPARP